MTSGDDVEVSIVLPAFNESGCIEKAVIKAMEELTKITDSFEVIIAEDGSSDGTDKIAENLSKRFGSVRCLHSGQRLGRGRALNRAFKQSKGSILVYMDVDLSTEPGYLLPLIDSIRYGWDIVTGSRMLPRSLVKRSRTRIFTSWAYNALVQLLFKTSVRDHQCGFKAFNREKLLVIIDEVEDGHWFWDTEVLALATIHGYSIREIPISWREERRATKVKLFHDSFKMGFKALSLWWRIKLTHS